MQLIYRLEHQRAVALHNPLRDLFVSFPGGILHDNPAILFGLLRGHTNRIVIVHIDDLSGSAFVTDRGQTLLRRALWHINHGVLLQLARHPCHAATVVAISGGSKRDSLQIVMNLFAGHHVKRQFTDILTNQFSDMARHRIGATQRFEGFQAKTLRFIFEVDIFYAQFLCKRR